MGRQQHIFKDFEREKEEEKNSMWWLHSDGKSRLHKDWTGGEFPPNSWMWYVPPAIWLELQATQPKDRSPPTLQSPAIALMFSACL